MKPNEDEPCAVALLLFEDDGAAFFGAVQTHVAALMALRMRVSAWRISRGGRYRGSLPGHRPNKQRDLMPGSTTFHETTLGLMGKTLYTTKTTWRRVFAFRVLFSGEWSRRTRTRPSSGGVSTRRASRRHTLYKRWLLPSVCSRMGRRLTALTSTCAFPVQPSCTLSSRWWHALCPDVILPTYCGISTRS